jgi:hypothetical protein
VGGGVVIEKGATMTIDEVEKELRTAIEAQISAGFKVQRGGGGHIRNNCGCALQAWAWNRDRLAYEWFEMATAYFKWNGTRAWAFIDGFDGKNQGNPLVSSTAEYQLGVCLAREYVDGGK